MAASSFQATSPASFRNDVEITPTEFCSPAGRSAFAIEAAALTSSNLRMPAQLRRPADGPRRNRRRAIEHERLGAGVFQDVELGIDRHIGLDGDVGHDHVGGEAEPFLQSPEQIAAELVAPPRGDPSGSGYADWM